MAVDPAATELPTASVRRVGRPAKLNREAIIKAAADIGFENVTMQSVADRLGVSVPGLYHYVRGKDDLLRLAAEDSAARIRLPQDRGQHWAVWLYEWATYSRDAFVAEPGLVRQFIDGRLGADRTADNIDAALGALRKHGFDIYAARKAHGLVTKLAIGAAVSEVRETHAAQELARVLDERDGDELPNLRALFQGGRQRASFEFDDDLLTVLRGIAVERGERWSPILRKLRQQAATRSQRR